MPFDRLSYLLFASALLVVPCGANAEANSFAAKEARQITRQLAHAIERPLPAPEEVLGSPPQLAANGMVVIANPQPVEPGQCGVAAAGRAVGAVLRVEMWGMSKFVAFAPPLSYWIDSEPTADAGARTELQSIAARLGPRWLVGGTIGKDGDGWKLAVSVEDAAGRFETSHVTQVIRPATANADIVDLAEQILKSVRAEPNHAELSRWAYLRGYPGDAFGLIVNAFEGSCESQEGSYSERLAEAWSKHPSYPTIAALYQQGFYRPDRASRRAELERIAGLAGAHPVVRIHTSWGLAFNSPRSEGVQDIPVLRAVASRYPHEPLSWYALANARSTFNLLYADHDDPGRRAQVTGGPVDHPAAYAESIAVAAKAVELWPESYASWLELATAITMYSQGIRGTCGWNCVPPSAKSRLPAIERVFDKVVERGLSRYPESSPLLAAKLVADQSVGRDWWGSFLLGARTRPHNFYLYQKAMIYSGDGWGGSASRRREVYELASKNNRGEDWPLQLYVDYAPWSETLSVRYATWFFSAIAMGVVGVILWRRRRSRMGD